jgi:integrase
MPRPTSVQIIRNSRKDGSITFGLRIRTGGHDEVVSLGNSGDGWDEVRVDAARKQLMAKIELGLWTHGAHGAREDPDEEPTFRELATDWLQDRKRNPAIRPRTIELNESQLTRYLAPFFGELRPSQITSQQIKQYRRQLHDDNAQIRAAREAGKPLVDPRTGQRLRTLGNESINKTLRTLAQILDEAEDASWIDRNPARGKRAREPQERRRRSGALDLDEFISLLDAAEQMDQARHSAKTLERAEIARALRNDAGLEWKAIAKHLGVAPTTAMYLYGCREPSRSAVAIGPRRGVIATLGLAGPRVTELCMLDNQDMDLTKARLFIQDSKTQAGVRDVDIHGRLLSELRLYRAQLGAREIEKPAFPSRSGTRRDKDNVRRNVVSPVVERANELRIGNEQPPIHVHVTPHTFRRTYITYMLAAGHDIPYVQSQVGHEDPTTTLAIYAQLIRRPDREQMRHELQTFLETAVPQSDAAATAATPHATEIQRNQGRSTGQIRDLRLAQKAGKGMKASL